MTSGGGKGIELGEPYKGDKHELPSEVRNLSAIQGM